MERKPGFIFYAYFKWSVILEKPSVLSQSTLWSRCFVYLANILPLLYLTKTSASTQGCIFFLELKRPKAMFGDSWWEGIPQKLWPYLVNSANEEFIWGKKKCFFPDFRVTLLLRSYRSNSENKNSLCSNVLEPLDIWQNVKGIKRIHTTFLLLLFISSHTDFTENEIFWGLLCFHPSLCINLGSLNAAMFKG